MQIVLFGFFVEPFPATVAGCYRFTLLPRNDQKIVARDDPSDRSDDAYARDLLTTMMAADGLMGR